MSHTTWVKEYKDGKFDVKVGYFPDDAPVEHTFDESCYDIKELTTKIDMGDLDYFVARVQYLYDGIEMGTSFLGGCLYEDANKAIEEGLDGSLEDMLDEARDEAKGRCREMVERLKKDFLEVA